MVYTKNRRYCSGWLYIYDRNINPKEIYLVARIDKEDIITLCKYSSELDAIIYARKITKEEMNRDYINCTKHYIDEKKPKVTDIIDKEKYGIPNIVETQVGDSVVDKEGNLFLVGKIANNTYELYNSVCRDSEYNYCEYSHSVTWEDLIENYKNHTFRMIN